MTRQQLVALAFALTASTGCSKSKPNGQADRPLRIATAASLTSAMQEVAAGFQAASGRQVEVSPGASGKLAAQLSDGAPYDVFASADEAFVDEVIDAGVGVAETKTIYAYGRVVVWTPPAAAPVTALTELSAPRFVKIALANPEQAPYGRAAREALEHAGVWAAVEPRLVYGTNVAQAMQYGETGNADASLTALSLVLGGKGSYYLVDESAHFPLAQVAVVIKHSKLPDDARAFVNYLNSEPGQQILGRYGLVQKGQRLAAP
jgi:molybdate transport system substrate-binding protein